MPPWWLPRGGISLNILIASGAWMYNEAYFRFACVQKRICDFMCAWMRYARVRKTEKPRVPHVQGLVENRNSGMRSTPRHRPIERPIAHHSLPARPMRPDSHASLNLKPTHWLKPTYYTCNKGLSFGRRVPAPFNTHTCMPRHKSCICHVGDIPKSQSISGCALQSYNLSLCILVLSHVL